MKRLLQNISDGTTELIEVPLPTVLPGEVLIRTTRSLVSLGTERMLVNFAKSNIFSKAKQQPEKVKMVLDKIKTDGLSPTIKSVKNKLNEPMPLGYCNVGVVEVVGSRVKQFNAGDRVISNGPHSEYVSISENLVHLIPNEVHDDHAAFTVLGSIGLQGLRLCNPVLGETIVVYGLGLIGLILIQLLQVNGCKVIGIDLDHKKVELAKLFGIMAINPNDVDEVAYVNNNTNNHGCDGVIITASAKTNSIISKAAKMSRKRGRIVLVGVVGLNLDRSDFYEKEITFQVSCSYGPGRYDYEYEEKGNDYPIGFVRWTENRNFGAILDLISKEKLLLDPLITNKEKFENAISVYDSIKTSKSIATIFEYGDVVNTDKTIKITEKKFNVKKGIVSIIGAGNFTSSTILPILSRLDYQIKYLGSSNGLNSTRMAKKFGIQNSTSDNKTIIEDEDAKLVFITTRHNTHSDLVLQCIENGKDVFVEKPLCINRIELDKIVESYSESTSKITVGFNRRFAPFTKLIKKLLDFENSAMNITINVNAGYIPMDSWTQDLNIGGGRIIGEACHFIDLCIFLTNSLVEDVVMNSMGIQKSAQTDNTSIILNHKSGSNSVINYFSNGSKKYSKERVEIYVNGKNIILDNWRDIKLFGFEGTRNKKCNQDKGHSNQFKELLDNISDPDKQLIPFDQIVNSTKTTFATIDSLKERKWMKIV